MSGETEEMTTDAKSVDSALIWTDNPELEYFRSMMANRTDDKLASGDSLIGDSTVREMLELGGVSPMRRIGLRDTSGLSDADSNTVDNIYVEDGSLLSKKKTVNRVFDDGTIESPEDEDLVPSTVRNYDGQNTHHDQHLNIRQETKKNSAPQQQPQCIFSPAEMNIPHGVHQGDENVASKESACIPGFIFVTDGHPSIVHTKKNDLQSDQRFKYKKRQKAICLPRSLIICVTLVVIIASAAVAVLVYRMKVESSELTSSSQSQNDGSLLLSPNSQPTSEPSSLRANNRPQIGAPTSYPGTDEFDSYSIRSITPSTHPSVSILNVALTSIPTNRPTTIAMNPLVPTVISTDSPETPPTSLTVPPTFSPTPSATATFTMVETSSSCTSTVETDETCYRNGDNIRISFNNCEPRPTDWIGIFPARQGAPNLNQPLAWIWTCGDESCNDSVVRGVAIINNVSRYGWFQAYLLRDNGNGDTVYAIGNSFTISSRCYSSN